MVQKLTANTIDAMEILPTVSLGVQLTYQMILELNILVFYINIFKIVRYHHILFMKFRSFELVSTTTLILNHMTNMSL